MVQVNQLFENHYEDISVGTSSLLMCRNVIATKRAKPVHYIGLCVHSMFSALGNYKNHDILRNVGTARTAFSTMRLF